MTRRSLGPTSVEWTSTQLAASSYCLCDYSRQSRTVEPLFCSTVVNDHVLIKEGNQQKQELDSTYKYVSLDPPLEIVDYSIAHERWNESVAYTLDERVLLIRFKDAQGE